MCTVSLLRPNPNFNLDYAEFNIDYTNDMWETANRVSLLTYAIPLALVFTAEVIKNGLFLLYNAAIFVINTTSSLLYRISLVFSDCIEGEFTLASINPFAEQPVVIPSDYSHEDLATFRLAMRSLATQQNPINEANPILTYMIDRQLAIWYDLDRDVICIQDRFREGHPTLAIKLDALGHILSLELDGAAQQTFPPEFDVYMWTCFQQAMMHSSQYSAQGNIRIRIVREGLKQVPDYHLERLSELITLMDAPPGITVSFLNFALQQGPEIDAGGPRRDYMDDLWDGLLNGNSHVLEFTRLDGMTEALPKASGAVNGDGIPRVLEQEIPSYQNMGKVMMYCNQSLAQMAIGRRFEEGVFKAIFSLTPAEVDADHLPLPVQLKMMRAIYECREANLNNNHPLLVLEGWTQGNIDWMHARDVAEWAGADVPDPDAENIADRFDPNSFAHQQIVLNALRENLYAGCGSALAPIHQMAKGMKEIRTNFGHGWGGINWQQFNNKVQGSLDRQFVADRLDVDAFVNDAVRMKAQWLRNWILNPNTPNQRIQDFIKFASGSSTLPANGTIRITTQHGEYLPVPKAHTCFSSIEISPVPAAYGRHNDYTEENFIESLELMNPNYQMG